MLFTIHLVIIYDIFHCPTLIQSLPHHAFQMPHPSLCSDDAQHQLPLPLYLWSTTKPTRLNYKKKLQDRTTYHDAMQKYMKTRTDQNTHQIIPSMMVNQRRPLTSAILGLWSRACKLAGTVLQIGGYNFSLKGKKKIQNSSLSN